MTNVGDYNAFGVANTLKTVEIDAEWAAYERLPSNIRRALQDCPYEFSAIDAEYLWKRCAMSNDPVSEFRYQLGRNVEHLRAEEKRIGVGNDIAADQALPRRFRNIVEGVVDPNAFSLY